jgi:hypothetical protein
MRPPLLDGVSPPFAASLRICGLSTIPCTMTQSSLWCPAPPQAFIGKVSAQAVPLMCKARQALRHQILQRELRG